MKTKYYFSIILLSIFFSVCENVNAQAPAWLWNKQIGGTANEYGNAIALDASGNVYTTGHYQSAVDFDPGNGVFNLTVSSGYPDVFISKLDNMGNFVWAKSLDGNHSLWVNSIAVDDSGNVYTTGWFVGTADFDPSSSGTFNLTSAGGDDIFICKLDSAGNFIWVKQIGGTSNDVPNSIVTDAYDNVYITGDFYGTVDFDPDLSSNFNLISAGIDDIFILKLNSMGNFVWAKRMGGTSFDHAYSIFVDASGNIYTTGQFIGNADFDPGAGTFILTSTTYSEIFISKLDSAGNFVWAKQMGGTPNDRLGYVITTDASGNVYTTGYFNGTADFNPDSLVTCNLISAGGKDIFISKLDSSGNFIWAKAMGGAGDDFGRSIVSDAIGNVYTTGSFDSIADLDPSSSANNNVTSAGYDDIFISKLDNSGNFVWAKTMDGTDYDYGNSLVLDASDNIYMTGYFRSPSLTFDSTYFTNANTIATTADLYIAKLGTINTGIENIEHKNNISLYPNPATNHLTITLPGISNKVTLTIADITGKIIYNTTEAFTQKIEVNAKDFSSGIYFVQIQTPGFVETKKLLVAK